MRVIPPQNRVGDYVHCNGRVVNIIFKRLLATFPDPRQSLPLKEIVAQLTMEAQGVPTGERLAPRHTKMGNLDLTASTLFVQNIALHGRIGNLFRQLNKSVAFGDTSINLGAAIQALFQTLHGLHSLWRQKSLLYKTPLKCFIVHYFFHCLTPLFFAGIAISWEWDSQSILWSHETNHR